MNFPSLRDLCRLDSEYISLRFKPWLHGISVEELADGLSVLNESERGSILESLDPSVRVAIKRRYSSVSASADRVKRASDKLFAVYFWELIYQLYPDAYEEFSSFQHFAFEEMFPRSVFSEAKVADLAAGSGKLTQYLLSNGCQVTAIDPAPRLLEKIASKQGFEPNLKVERGTFDSTFLSDASVDFVVSCLGFQHSEERGGESGIREMLRILKVGGEIRLIVGSRCTAEWLLSQGFEESQYPRCLVWRIPEKEMISPLSLLLLRVVGVPEVYGVDLKDRWVFGANQELASVYIYRK